MSTYTMNAATVGQMPTIDIGHYMYDKKFPNQKINISIHGANGGYIMEIATHPGQVAELYIIPDEKDLGNEIGKIITMKVLKEKHE